MTVALRRTASKQAAIVLQITARGGGLPKPAQVRRWAAAALTGAAEVTVRIVGTAESQRLNREYRRRDCATNVLSFSYDSGRGSLRGDLVLCAPVVRREARTQGKTLEAHFAHLIVHGLLHLRGYDHETWREAVRMEALEKRLLAKLGYADPYRSEN